MYPSGDRREASAGILDAPARRHQKPVVELGRGKQISYIGVLLAVLIGILHATLAPVLTIADVHPNIVLVAVVLVTTLGGFGPGVVWAFVAGLTANLLGREPLGSIPLALLLVAAAAAGGNRLFARLAWAYPVVAVLIGSIAMDLVSLGILRLVDPSLAGGLPTERLLTAAFLNAGIAALLVLPARLVAARVSPEETVAW